MAALVVYLDYFREILRIDPSLSNTAGIFTTFPAQPDYLLLGLFDQVLGTFLLLFLILVVLDHFKRVGSEYLIPIIIGLLVMVIGMSFGGMYGYAINPARDFGPRLMTVMLGFSNNGLTDGTLVYLVPIVGPLIAGTLGALAYDFTLGRMYSTKK